MNLKLEWLPGRFAVCKLPPDAAVPAWAGLGAGHTSGQQPRANSKEPSALPSILCITRTDQELSIVTIEQHVPSDVTAERGFVAMRLVGQIDMATVGVFATLTAVLKEARVPVFLISTYLTDYLLVRETDAERAAAALRKVADVGPRQV